MDDLTIALIAAACVAGAYGEAGRTGPKHARRLNLIKAQTWSERTAVLADRVAGAALSDRKHSGVERCPLPFPAPKRRD